MYTINNSPPARHREKNHFMNDVVVYLIQDNMHYYYFQVFVMGTKVFTHYYVKQPISVKFGNYMSSIIRAKCMTSS